MTTPLSRALKAMLFALISLSLAALLQTQISHAATVTWDGGGADNNWSTDENWSGDSAPGSSDDVVFDGTSVKDSSIDTDFTINSIVINDNYSGEINHAASVTLTTGASGSFSMYGGTYNSTSTSTLDINQDFNLGGGTFNAPATWNHDRNITASGGTFNAASNSTVLTFDTAADSAIDVSSEVSFYDVIVSKSTSNRYVQLATGDTIVVNSLTVVDGRATSANSSTSIWKVSGSGVSYGAATDNSNAHLTFTGTGSQVIHADSGAEAKYDGHITVNKGSGTLTFTSDITMEATSFDFTVSAGAVDLASYTLEVTRDFLMTGGSFDVNTGTLDVEDDMDIDGGTFTAGEGSVNIRDDLSSTGATFNAESSTFTFDENGESDVDDYISFYNLTLNKSLNTRWLQVGSNTTVTVTNDLTLVNGRLIDTDSTSFINVEGNVNFQSTMDTTSDLTLVFTGGNTQSFDIDSGAEALYDGHIYTNKSGGQVSLTDSYLDIDAANIDFVIQEGTFDLNGKDLTVNGTNSELDVETGGNLQLQGSETITANASNPDLQIGSTVTYDDTSGTETIKTYSYDNLTINGSGGTFQLGANQTITGDLTVTAGTFDANDYTLTVQNNLTVDGGTYKTGTGATELGSAEDKAIAVSSGEVQVELSNPGSDLIIGTGTTWTNTGGTITYNAAGSVTVGTIDGITAYNNITINSSGSLYGFGSATDINGDVTLTAGTLDTAMFGVDITVAGDWNDTGSGAFNEGTNTVTFDGTGTTYSNEAFYNVAVNGGTRTLGSSLDVDGSVTLSSGTLDVSASNYAIDVAASWTDTGSATFNDRAGTVTFSNTGTLNANDAFYNLTINHSGTSTLGGNLDVDNDLTITSGTLDASSSNYNITLGGNWSNSGTFTERSGTVTFDTSGTTSTISNAETFYNLSSTTGGKNITFPASATTTVSGTMTFTGASGNLITLRSSSSGTVWTVAASTSSVDYIDVKDSTATTAITHAVDASRSTDSGNNTNWGFNDVPTVTTVTASQSSNGDGDVTITFIMDDPDDDDTLQAKIEYSINSGSSWADPTLSTTDSETTASAAGDPSVDNAETYQVGQSGSYILTSSGANTISIVWEAATDVDSSTDLSTAKIRVTPYDGSDSGTAASSSDFTLDVVAPTNVSNVVGSNPPNGNLDITWTVGSDTNFSHYEVWHGGNETDVLSRSATEWDNSDDTPLGTVTTTSTSISGIGGPVTTYYIVCTVDTGGYSTCMSSAKKEEVLAASSSSSSSSSSSGGGGGGRTSSSSSSSTDDDSSSDDSGGGSIIPVSVPDHWSSGYLKNLESEDRVIEEANNASFISLLLELFTTPDEGMSRGKALHLLMTLNGDSQKTLPTSYTAFTDVDSSNERAGLIEYAFENDLIHGYPDGTFQADRIVNRAEALKMATYFYGLDVDTSLTGQALLDEYGLTENPFTDVDLSAWYASTLMHAYVNGVVSGYGDGTFGPGNPVTYAEFVKIATLMQNIEEAVELASELE